VVIKGGKTFALPRASGGVHLSIHVDCVIVRFVACDMSTSGLTAASSGSFLEFCGGFEIRLRDPDVWAGGSGLVDRECELHTLDGARPCVLTSFAVALLFRSALAD
jgi:hypothetical protein